MELIRIARIAMPDASYDASVPAQTSEAVGDTILNPIDFVEIADLNLAKSSGNTKRNHAEFFNAFTGTYSMDANVVNLHKINKKAGESKSHFRVRNLLFLQGAIQKL